MKTATLRDLRNNFSKLENWLREGEEIQIRRRSEVVAVLSLPSPGLDAEISSLPDFSSRRARLELNPLSESDLRDIQAFDLEGQQG